MLSLKEEYTLRENIFACLFSVHNTISLSRHEQVCLITLCLRDTTPTTGQRK